MNVDYKPSQHIPALGECEPEDGLFSIVKLFSQQGPVGKNLTSAPSVLWLPFVDLLHSDIAAFCDVFHRLVVGRYDSYTLGNSFGGDRVITCDHDNLEHRQQQLVGSEGLCWLSRGLWFNIYQNTAYSRRT